MNLKDKSRVWGKDQRLERKQSTYNHWDKVLEEAISNLVFLLFHQNVGLMLRQLQDFSKSRIKM